MTVMMLPTAGEYARHKGERFETDGVVYNVGGTECYLLKGYGLFAIDMLEVVDELKYRKKPVTIEAYQTDVELDIPTLEGTMHASVGDYIITGVRGERYPCKPDIFLETYEPSQGDVDATVGAGTCRNEWPDHFAFRCSECGGSWYGVGLDARPYPRFCPNCGREVTRDEQ